MERGRIDRHAVEQLLAGGDAVLVEALGRIYFDDAHLPGAVNLPHDQVDARAPALLPDRDATIVVYCSDPTCPSSTIAARRLAELGYRNVLVYAGGKQDWIEAGLPVERAER